MNSVLLARAARLRELHEANIGAGDAQRRILMQEFHQLRGEVVAPYEAASESMKSGDFRELELVIEYLELHPRFFGSGYLTEKLIRRVATAPLSRGQRHRVVVALRGIAAAPVRERGAAARMLARWGSDLS